MDNRSTTTTTTTSRDSIRSVASTNIAHEYLRVSLRPTKDFRFLSRENLWLSVRGDLSLESPCKSFSRITPKSKKKKSKCAINRKHCLSFLSLTREVIKRYSEIYLYTIAIGIIQSTRWVTFWQYDRYIIRSFCMPISFCSIYEYKPSETPETREPQPGCKSVTGLSKRFDWFRSF